MSRPDPPFRARRATRGFTLVELMVALVISLLIGLAAFGAAQATTSLLRQAQGADGAQASAALANDALKSELSLAGLGFYASGGLRCTSLYVSWGSKDYSSDSGGFMPLRLSTATDGSLVVDAIYGSAMESAAPATLAAPSSSQESQFEIASYLPASAGQALLLASDAQTPAPCTVKGLSGMTPAGGGHGERLLVDAASPLSQLAHPAVNYPSTGTATVLGNLRWSRFALAPNGDLTMASVLSPRPPVVLAHQVMGFAAQYGVLDASQSAFSGWQDPQGAWATLTPALLAQVRALRVGLVLRSTEHQKPDANGACDATPNLPLLLDRPLVLTGDWHCWRYRSTVINVPLRNAILGSGS